MSRLTRDGTAEPVSQDQILRRKRGQGKNHFPCSADHVQDWQPYPVDPCSYHFISSSVATVSTVVYFGYARKRDSQPRLRHDYLSSEQQIIHVLKTCVYSIVVADGVGTHRPPLPPPPPKNGVQVQDKVYSGRLTTWLFNNNGKYVCRRLFRQSRLGTNRYGCQLCSWSAQQGKCFFPCPLSRLLRSSSPETSSDVPFRVSPPILHTQAESDWLMVHIHGFRPLSTINTV